MLNTWRKSEDWQIQSQNYKKNLTEKDARQICMSKNEVLVQFSMQKSIISHIINYQPRTHICIHVHSIYPVASVAY